MKKISIYLSVFLVILMVGIYFVFWPKTRFELAKDVIAGGGFPIQVGFTGITITDCTPSCCTPVCSCCSGGTTCMSDIAPACLSYDVSGTPNGGYTMPVLMSAAQYSMLTNGGQMIAGGSAPTFMASGVVASDTGCLGVGCTAINDKNIFERYYEIIKYGIASFKD